jgi:hypothetical protein
VTRITISPAAYLAIVTTFPEGAAMISARRSGSKYYLYVEETVLNQLKSMRGPGEDYSDVILRLVDASNVQQYLH